METTPTTCPACGARWRDGQTCQDDFYQMLYWEAEAPALGVVHHLMVLCYYLQHPHLYSREGLQHASGLLVEFVAGGVTPQEARQHNRSKVASDNRSWTVSARPDSVGAYAHPAVWTMTGRDVVEAGIERYVEQVRAWAQSIYDSLLVSHNLPPDTP